MAATGLPSVSAPLPWQASLWSRLNQQIDSQQLPHALLLAGPQYAGKSRLALALARLLLCSEPRDGMNCGHCHACELSASGTHGDLRWLEPEQKSRVIKIDQVRQVVEFANKTANLGLRKVVVLSPADSMNTNAANALLKSLEEPARDTYLILVCHRLHGLPATIRSRCQMLRMAMPDSAQCLSWLDQMSADRAESEKLLQLAGGRVLLAEQLCREAGSDHLASVRSGLQGLLSGATDVPEIMALVADESIEKVLAQMLAELENTLRMLDQQGLASRQGRAAFGLMDEITRMQRALGAGANPNRQLLVEALLAKYERELGAGGLGDSIHG